MLTCPFCSATLDEKSTVCAVCGHSVVSAPPFPSLAPKRFYFVLSIFSILVGIGSCAFTFVPRLYMGSLVLIIASVGLGGFILERTRGRSGTRLVKVLAAVGMFFGVLGYISFMFLRSNVPGIGARM
ncbi:MAG: hypothetical protein JSV10_08805 [Candidatus Zixiibacteriota bacterium]|nr:MAG: hypothetical protein JSV10_08805 [candidate division Zixibacteria bacterium]